MLPIRLACIPLAWPCRTKQSQSTKASKASLLTSPLSQFPNRKFPVLCIGNLVLNAQSSGHFRRVSMVKFLQIEKIPCKFPYSREFGRGDRFDQGCIHHHAFTFSADMWRRAENAHQRRAF